MGERDREGGEEGRRREERECKKEGGMEGRRERGGEGRREREIIPLYNLEGKEHSDHIHSCFRVHLWVHK